MKLRSNKGSTMLLVVIITAILFILGGAMVSVISVNYRAKAKESNRIKNLYEAEAGLDVAYNIIAKAFDAGVVAGNYEVNKTTTAIEERTKNGENISQDDIETKKEDAFKIGFKKYINNNDGSLEVNENENLFKQSLTYDEGNSSDDTTYRYVVNEDGDSVKFESIEIKAKDGLDKPIIECEKVELNGDEYSVIVSSQFETETSTGKNTRSVQVTYKIKIPDYEEGDSSSVQIEKPLEIDSKVISIDGNMKINGNNSGNKFTIDGDIFVKGNENDDSTKNSIVYNKYKGGIEITGSQSKVTMTGDVVTSKTFNVNSNLSDINIEKNLYAGNVYIGNKDGTASPKSILNINNVITDNDFAVKSNGSNITIENFYGINDKNIQSDVSGKQDKTSSSIIVNNDKNNTYSSLTISNEAYIMGVAYINAQKDGEYYQTGESVAIKGNYVAYTKPLEDIKNLEFGMYGSLQMIDKVNESSLDVLGKSEYFQEFAKQASDGEITDGGVYLNKNKTYTIGAVVYKDGDDIVVEKSNYTNSTNEKVTEKQNEYAKQVYAMGNSNDDELKDIYDNQEQKTISETVIDFTKIQEFTEKNKANEKLVLNGDENKTIVLSNRNYTGSSNEIVISVGDEVNGLIISKGNIKLDGDFEFNGAIIGGGNLEIYNRGNSDINYDKDVVNNIINNNYLILKDVFRETSADVSVNTINNVVTSNSYRYNAKEYIISQNWKIRKNVK